MQYAKNFMIILLVIRTWPPQAAVYACKGMTADNYKDSLPLALPLPLPDGLVQQNGSTDGDVERV